MARYLVFSLAALMATTLLLGGCSEREEAPAVKDKIAERLVIPEAVQGQWKAVRISVVDKSNGRTDVYTVDLGTEFKIANSEVRLRADNFLPAFVIENKTITSDSNEPRNPAVQIVVTENGKEIYKGWLFKRFPGTHAMQHPRFSFTLVDFVEAQQKKG